MKESSFDYEGAVKAGYSDEEIIDHLASSHPDFDVNEAYRSGYSSKEINQHLSTREKPEPKKERSLLAKAGRIAGQYALGRAEGTTPGMIYDVATLPLRLPGGKETLRDMFTSEFLSEVYPTEEEGKAPAVEELQPPTDISIRGLVGKATGIDTHPEGFLEKMAAWTGFVKGEKGTSALKSVGLNPGTVTKAIAPGFKDLSRGVFAGAALQMAENGNFGPLGTIAAAVVGDIMGHSPKGIIKAIMNPKQTAAQAVNFLTQSNSQKLASAQLIEDFAKSGIQLDAGTLSGSPLVQMVQARLSQSGLTGTALDNMRKEMSAQIVKEYESILGDIGELTFENTHQASEAIKEALKTDEVALNTNKQSLAEQGRDSRSLEGRVAVQERPDYQENLLNRIASEETQTAGHGGEQIKATALDIKKPIKEKFDKRWTDLNNEVAQIQAGPQAQLVSELETFIRNNEGSLLLGTSTAESGVVTAAQDLLAALRGEGNTLRNITLDQLVKTKRTLQDIADYEFGGSNFESAYKKLAADVDEAIQRALVDNKELRGDFLNLNADYSNYKRTFENKNLKKVFEPQNENFNSIYHDFVRDPDKLVSLEAVLGQTEEGTRILNQIKRDYAQKVIEKPNVTARELRELERVLGPEFVPDIHEFNLARQEALENPLPRVQQQAPLGVTAQTPQTQATKALTPGRVSETGTEAARAGMRKKLLESFKNKDGSFQTPEQIFQRMNTIDGIREMKKVLNTTPEGKELFKELSRYKIAEMIDRRMTDQVTKQVNLGTFSGLAKTSKDKAILKELLGNEAYARLERLQKNSGQLAKSAAKFYNASQSGTSLVDAGLVGTAITGTLLGQPWVAAPALLKIGGSYVLANLLSDPVFLKELEKAILSNDPKVFERLLRKMTPELAKQTGQKALEAQDLKKKN